MLITCQSNTTTLNLIIGAVDKNVTPSDFAIIRDICTHTMKHYCAKPSACLLAIQPVYTCTHNTVIPEINAVFKKCELCESS